MVKYTGIGIEDNKLNFIKKNNLKRIKLILKIEINNHLFLRLKKQFSIGIAILVVFHIQRVETMKLMRKYLKNRIGLHKLSIIKVIPSKEDNN
jgi:hypothetical protein